MPKIFRLPFARERLRFSLLLFRVTSYDGYSHEKLVVDFVGHLGRSKMTDELPIADVPSGFFEYHADFKEPVFFPWFGKDAPTGGMYKTLMPWGLELNRVAFNTNPKTLQDIQTSFSTTNPPVVVNLGLGSLAFIVQNADWSQAPVLIPMLEAVLTHVKAAIPTEVHLQTTVLGFHVKPGPKPFRETMQQFINAKALGADGTENYGLVLYGPTYTILIDRSLAIPDGLFVKITRVFPAETLISEMASIMWKDEEEFLHRLGFRTQ